MTSSFVLSEGGIFVYFRPYSVSRSSNMEEIKDTDYCDIMEKSYIDYAMSVITARAVPDVRDGLKPVQRRVLYSMNELGLKSTGPHRKSARIVGDAMGKYHPHGDSSIYEALVVMSQGFKKEIPLVDGHGNFGSIEGDGAAAMRYTEARLANFTEKVYLDGLSEDIVDFVPNFDETEKEPSVLPCRLPCVLINGSEGIAVGMTTSIPTHNPSEVIDAEMAMLKDPKADPLRYIKGPDFPTGGIVVNKKDLKEIYGTGVGKIKIRGKAVLEEEGRKKRLVVTEIPYTMIGSGIERFISDVSKLIEERKIPGIADISNESSKEGMRIVIDLKKDADPQAVEAMLYKKTRLEDTFGVNMLVIKDGRPEVMSLKDILKASIDFQHELLIRQCKFRLKKDEASKHIKEGLIKACDMIDLIVEVIRGSKTTAQAKRCLTSGDITGISLKTERSKKRAAKLSFTEPQANAILALKLSGLIGLEIEQLKKEYDILSKNVDRYNAILSDKKKQTAQLIKDLEKFKKEYAAPRKTQIIDADEVVIKEKGKEPEEMVFCMDRFGYAKLISKDALEKNEETVKNENRYVFDIMTDDRACLFTAQGNIYQINASKIPVRKTREKGIPIDNISKFSSASEDIASVFALNDIRDKTLLFATKLGMVKAVKGDEFIMSRYSGPATKLKEEDRLLSVVCPAPKTMTFDTTGGRRLTISLSGVPLQKKNAVGVIGIKLSEDDTVEHISYDMQNEEIGKRGTKGKKKEA